MGDKMAMAGPEVPPAGRNLNPMLLCIVSCRLFCFYMQTFIEIFKFLF